MPDNLFRGGLARYSKRKSVLDKILIFALYLGLIALGAWLFTVILDLAG